MSKNIKFLTWNVENFHADEVRVPRVVKYVADQKPDIFALSEVKGRQVFRSMVNMMPKYHITITESLSVPEILVGVRSNITSFVMQRNELKSKVPTLRPGALATLKLGGKLLSFLFLHLKSFDEPRSWGLRDDMFGHITSLKRTLDREMTSGQKANYIVLGDLNTMGMAAKYNDQLDIDGAEELGFIDKRMEHSNNGMRRLTKSHDMTWWNGKDNWKPSDLDHVYSADHLSFKTSASDAEVTVAGWVEKEGLTAQKKWIDEMSDHCALIGQVEISSLN